MRSLSISLLIVIAVVLINLSSRRAAPAPDAGTFRVATFNIHKGADRRGDYDLDRTIDAIQHLDADLVGVQEAMRNHPGSSCDDQPALMAEGLRRRTGRPWTHTYVKAWINRNRECLESGRGDEVETEGVVFLTPHRVISSNSVRLSEGRVGLAVRVASLPRVPFIVTHLTPSRQSQADRIRELGVLLPWAARQGPGGLLGDLNAEPDASELGPVMTRYRDAWSEAASRGRADGARSGATRPGRRASRIDYVFFAPEIGFDVESVQVIDPSTLPGLGEVSDHFPVVATFRRRSQMDRP